jgi:hypothetical protein
MVIAELCADASNKVIYTTSSSEFIADLPTSMRRPVHAGFVFVAAHTMGNSRLGSPICLQAAE